MKRHFYLLYAVLAIVYAVALAWGGALAQGDEIWGEPETISSVEGSADRATLVGDPYGYVHAVWPENGFEDQRPILQHAQFDGTSWSTPNDIVVGNPRGAIRFPSMTIDGEGFLHLVWTGSQQGPIYYATAPAWEAHSAPAWSTPEEVILPAYQARLHVDQDSVLHLVYSVYLDEPRGVFYTSSSDGGGTWSVPRQFDPDIPREYAPQSIGLSADDQGGLHVLWLYTEPNADGVPGRWIRYAHSLDGGSTWSAPFTIQRDTDPAGSSIRAAGPVLGVSGDTVMVMWAGGDQPYRNQMVSRDRGVTWSNPQRITSFGELQGQAGESLVVDDLGRIHYLGQIRYPMAVYHSIWDGRAWSPPTSIYSITGSGDPPADRIHAHNVNGAFRAGNQLVTTFTDSPGVEALGLYATAATLSSLPQSPVVSLPAVVVDDAQPTATAAPMENVLPEATPLPAFPQDGESVDGRIAAGRTPLFGLALGILPAIALIALVVGFIGRRR